MAHPNISIRLITVPASSSIRVWDRQNSMAMKNFNIFLHSDGVPVPGQINWEVFYGGSWSVDVPFATGATLTGGVSQGTGNVGAGAVEVAEMAYTETGIIPPNFNTEALSKRGPAYSIHLTNTIATDAILHVIFMSENFGDGF